MSEPEEPTTICDRCGAEIPVEESQAGPTGTDWVTCTMCNDCYAEVNPE
jgi:predicted Zn finger-like uncharacterized protein